MSTKIVNREQQRSADQKLADGLAAHATTLASFVIAGQVIKTADIIATLTARQTTAKAVESTRATWRAAVDADRAELQKSRALVLGVKQALRVMYAGSIDTLAQFGLTPRKPSAVKPATRVAAAAQAKATRAARHTTGSKQKKGIKGTVTTLVPVDGGAHAPAQATPSPATPPTTTATKPTA